MVYNKTQRNKTYRQGLKLLPVEKSRYGFSICVALEMTKIGLKDNLLADNITDYFEELQLFIPKNKVGPNGLFWLEEDDLQTRQIILDFCILMTDKK